MTLKDDWKEPGERDNWVNPGAGLGMVDGPRQDPDPEMERVLRDFRLSVHAWSEGMYQSPRLVEVPPRRIAWRRAAGWALGSVLVIGSAGGGLLGFQHRNEQARIAAAHEAEHQRHVQEERARQAAEELAKVDTDVSQQVPDALQPLAQLMTSDSSQ